MNLRDNDEERLCRIERILEQLQKDSAAFKHVAAKVIEAVVEAAPSLSQAQFPMPPRPHKGRD